MLLAVFMVMLDTTIVNVAIPSIRTDLGLTDGQAEWVVGAYALAYGVFLIPGGRLGDAVGRRRIFLLGVVGFTVASVLCAVAGSAAWLIAWCAVQGACAGLAIPQVIATIPVRFPPRMRGTAFGVYGGTIGAATALGPLVGGSLITANLHGLGWQSIFYVNVPIGVITVVAALALVPESRGGTKGLDLLGTVLLAGALLLLLVPLTSGGSAGWPVWTYVSMACTVPALAVFAAHQTMRRRRGRIPLMDLRLFAHRSFSAGVAIALVYFAGFTSVFFTMSVFLQAGMHRSALYAGTTLMPFAVGSFLSAPQSGRLARRLGRGVLLIGASAAFVGLTTTVWVIHHYGSTVSGWALAPGLLVAGLGSGLIVPTNIDFALTDVPRHEAGAAGGIVTTAQRTGQAFGVALLGDLFFRSVGHRTPTDFTHAIQVALLGNLAGIVLTIAAILLIPRRS
jgi:EmrB/QacA subfamily drug resistance transporter